MSERYTLTTDLLPDAIRARRNAPGQAARAIMDDLLWKFSRGDWHGVSDAANDLRVLEAMEAK